MGDETSDAMNLDLNLGPGPEPAIDSTPSESVNLEGWIDEPSHRLRAAMRLRTRQGWRWRQLDISSQTQNISMELNQLLSNSSTASMLQAGEGSVPADGRTKEVHKTCDSIGITEDMSSEKKDDVEKGNRDDGSFFDCNICLDLAREPVVTCCGHLFCWPCLYRWLHVHSDAKECPVCKGEVTIKNLTPIYGRGNHASALEEELSVKIPLRPQARRVESLRQTIQRNLFAFPVEEMIRRIGSRIDLARDVVQPNDVDVRDSAERTTSSLLNRFLTSRGLRREQSMGPRPDEVVDLTQDIPEESHRAQPILLRRTQSQRTSLASLLSAQRTNINSLSSALTSAERLVEAYFRNLHPVMNQEQPPPVDDRDSFSSVAAGINSESQMDSAVEIDSLVSLSTSSSRRRSDSTRVSDSDSGDSRAPRRRRLQ